MGIKGLLPFLKQKVPNAFTKKSFNQFKGKKVAIDAFNWMWSSYSTAFKKVCKSTDLGLEIPDKEVVFDQWIINTNFFLQMWLKNNITPVFVFDGKKIQYKENIQKERIKKSEEIKSKIEQLITEIKQKDILDRTTDDTNELQKLLNQEVFPDKNVRNKLKEYLISLGIPVLNAKGDGEHLCSLLCRDSFVEGVVSTDSDCLTFGCRTLIYKVDKMSDEPFYCIDLEMILEGLEMSHFEFVEMCILFGCDYNTNIKGIGPKKAYQLIVKHRNINEINLDKTVLNYEICRGVFDYGFDEVLDGEMCIELVGKSDYEYMKVGQIYNIRYLVPLIRKCLNDKNE